MPAMPSLSCMPATSVSFDCHRDFRRLGIAGAATYHGTSARVPPGMDQPADRLAEKKLALGAAARDLCGEVCLCLGDVRRAIGCQQKQQSDEEVDTPALRSQLETSSLQSLSPRL